MLKRNKTSPFEGFCLIVWNIVRFAHNWNDGMLEYWNTGIMGNGELGIGNWELGIGGLKKPDNCGINVKPWSERMNLVRFAHNWNNGMVEYWSIGFKI